jgi:hypothetical protein
MSIREHHKFLRQCVRCPTAAQPADLQARDMIRATGDLATTSM